MYRHLVVIVLMLLVGATASAAETATVGFPLLNQNAGEQIQIEAQIECPGSGCSAFDLSLRFDPQVLSVESVSLGPFLGTQAFTVQNQVDNIEGTITVAATALGDAPSGEENVLLVINARTLQAGTSPLWITRVEIGDEVGNPVSVSAISGAVIVQGDGLATTAQPVDAAPADSVCEYRVGSGDTLFGIALANGVSVDEIIALNDIPDRSVIRLGSVLKLPTQDCKQGLRSNASDTSSQSGDIIPVHDCVPLGNGLFQWYSVRREYDSNGVAISETRVGGPFVGEWQSGCPGSGTSGSSGSGGGSGSTGGGSSSGGGGSSSGDGDSGDGDSGGGGLICVLGICL